MQVFVYGTLTDPDRVDAVLGASPRRTRYELGGNATLEGLRRVEGQYPTLAPGGRVEGKLLAVDETGVEVLDRYEGVDRGLYARVRVPRADASDGSVWTYVGDPERLALEGSVEWPGDGPLTERVRTHVAREEVVVRPHE